MPPNKTIKSAAEVAVKLGISKSSVFAVMRRLRIRALANGVEDFSFGVKHKNQFMFSDDEVAQIKSAMVGTGNYEGNSRPRSAPPAVPPFPLAKAKPVKSAKPKRKGLKRGKPKQK